MPEDSPRLRSNGRRVSLRHIRAAKGKGEKSIFGKNVVLVVFPALKARSGIKYCSVISVSRSEARHKINSDRFLLKV